MDPAVSTADRPSPLSPASVPGLREVTGSTTVKLLWEVLPDPQDTLPRKKGARSEAFRSEAKEKTMVFQPTQAAKQVHPGVLGFQARNDGCCTW